jgi:3-methyladenine DNA glycosylase AlkD
MNYDDYLPRKRSEMKTSKKTKGGTKVHVIAANKALQADNERLRRVSEQYASTAYNLRALLESLQKQIDLALR